MPSFEQILAVIVLVIVLGLVLWGIGRQGWVDLNVFGIHATKKAPDPTASPAATTASVFRAHAQPSDRTCPKPGDALFLTRSEVTQGLDALLNEPNDQLVDQRAWEWFDTLATWLAAALKTTRRQSSRDRVDD